MLVDLDTGDVLDTQLYCDPQPTAAVAFVESIAPDGHVTRAATSALCKLASWHVSGLLRAGEDEGRRLVLMGQCDWLSWLLHGEHASDWNNTLKLGFDPHRLEFPEWLLGNKDVGRYIPRDVYRPGAAVARVTAGARDRYGLPAECVVHAGTTDSIAAFVAAGVKEPGEAVSSLGSTLAVKIVSEAPVEDERRGVYSHRLGEAWLVGGASNVGGAVLREFFTDEELRELTPRVDPSVDTGLGYYPLPSQARGERFPVSDPEMKARLEPRPEDDAVFLQGIFEGIADVEARAYRLVAEMGASPVTRVVSCGGGASNPKWTEIRERRLGVPVTSAENGEASFGAALLGMRG